MTGSAAEIVRAFSAVENEMRRSLGAIDVGNFSEVGAWKTHNRLNKLLDGLNIFTARWARRAMGGKYADAQATARTRLEMIGAKRNHQFDKKKHARAVDKSVEVTVKDYVKATGKMRVMVGRYIDAVRRYSKSIVRVQEMAAPDDWDSVLGELGDAYIDELVAAAIAANQTQAQLSKTILAWLRENLGGGDFIEINGRWYNLRSYAQLIADVHMTEIATQSVKNNCAEYDNDLVQFSTHANPCEECADLEGEIFSISGTDPEYQNLTSDVEPPIHPHCGHGLHPITRAALNWKHAEA